MKQSGKCPKCESSTTWNNHHLKNENYRRHLLGGWILVHVSGLFGRIQKHVFKEDYICVNCGYSETFIEEEGLKTIREYGVTERQE